MRTRRTTRDIFLNQSGTFPIRTQLRRLVLIAAISSAAFCQSSAASADDSAAPVSATGISAIAASLDLPPQIINFKAHPIGHCICVVSGVVIEDDRGSVIIQFGGYLQGDIIEPAADG